MCMYACMYSAVSARYYVHTEYEEGYVIYVYVCMYVLSTRRETGLWSRVNMRGTEGFFCESSEHADFLTLESVMLLVQPT
jgi:hypothetical protein